MKLSIMMAAGAGLAAATPLRVRQTESKRPFVQPAEENDFGKCGNPLFGGNTLNKSEACVGTLKYCQKGYYAQSGESFGSAEACVASREPAPPAPLKPFKQPDYTIKSCGNPLFAGNTQDESEACVGTLNYCEKGYYAQFDESFGSAEECVGSRQDPSLKPFFSGPNWNDFGACGNPLFGGNKQGHSEPCVGTVMYCSKGYWAEYKEESFAGEEECLKARNPEFAAPKPAPAPPSVPTPEPTPEPESKPTSKSASESASEVTLIPGLTSKPASEPESKPTSTPTPTPETTLKPVVKPTLSSSQFTSTPTPGLTSKPASEPESKPAQSASQSTSTPTPTPETTLKPVVKPTQSASQSTSTPTPTPETSLKPVVKPSESASESAFEPTPEPAPVQACIPPKEDEDRWVWA